LPFGIAKASVTNGFGAGNTTLQYGREVILIAKGGNFRVKLDNADDAPIGYKRKAAPTWELAHSIKSSDIAELQWRLSMPVFAFLMGLLGFPLSRANPREGKYAKLLMSAVSYGAFYNLQLIAQTWVEQGVVKPIPGLWWPDLLLALLIVGLIWNRPRRAKDRGPTPGSRR